MNVQVAVGIFFLVLALVFAIAVKRDNRPTQNPLPPAVKTRRRIAMIFALVGLGLLLWHFFNR